MADGAARLVSLAVHGGPLDGRHVDIAAVDEITVGADSSCSLVVDLPGVSPIHAMLFTDREGARVRDTRSTTGVFVGGVKIEGDRPLREGDTISLGPPGEPDSVVLRCRFVAADAGAEPGSLALDVADSPVSLSGFDDLPAPPAPPAPQAPAAPAQGGADFVVAGFSAQWPETGASHGAPAPPAAPGAADDPFFIGETLESESPSPPPKAAPAEAADDPFFFTDDSAPSPPPIVDAGGDEDRPPPAMDFFFGEEAVPIPAVPPPASERPTVPLKAEPIQGRAPAPAPPTAPPVAKEPPPVAKPAAPAAKPASPPPETVSKPTPAAAPAVAPAPTAAPAPAARPAAPRASVPPATPAARPAAAPPQERRRPEAGAPARRPEAGPAARRPSGAVRAPARPAPRGRAASPNLARYAGIGVAALVVLGLVAFLALRFLGGGASLDGIEPTRARAGQTVSISGSGFASDAKANQVLFGEKPASVLSASATRLEVVVPDGAGSADETKVAVRVKVGSATSRALDFTVLGGPAIHGISPDVAMPGDEVVLAGTGWGLGATVRFGQEPAQVVDVKDTSIRVRVPQIAGGPGTPAPAVVQLGNVSSNEMPFFVGTIPLVLKVDPPSASPGETVTITGRGFQRDRTRNAVVIGGTFALVAAAFDTEIKAVVPVLPAGEATRPLEVRVAGLANVGRASLGVPPLPDSMELRFVAQPFDAVAGRDHAVIATELGPAFVLAAAGGRSSADRAVEAERRLNDAMSSVRATRGLNFEARNLETNPVIGLAGRPEVLLEITDEDARAYDEDWTGLKGRGGPVTRGRLARWWEAVARDLVLLVVRGEKPQFSADLAPEGRVFGEVFQAAQKAGRFGVAREVVAGLRPPQRDALRLVGLRVPAGVTAPTGLVAPVAPAAAPGPAAGAASPPPAGPGGALKLDGVWIGSETEGEEKRYLTATFERGSGTIAYEGIVTLTVPLMTLEPQRTAVRFSLQFRGGLRYYSGKWDGHVLSGKISRDPAGTDTVGTFELRPR